MNTLVILKGVLEYRGLHFETERLEEENHQGVAVMNYTEGEIPYTRIIEHKHFEFGTSAKNCDYEGISCRLEGGRRALLPSE